MAIPICKNAKTAIKCQNKINPFVALVSSCVEGVGCCCGAWYN